MSKDKILILRIYTDDVFYPHVTFLQQINYFDLDLCLKQNYDKNTQMFFSRQLHLVKQPYPYEGYWETKIYCSDDINVLYQRKSYTLLREHINIINVKGIIKYMHFNQESIMNLYTALHNLDLKKRFVKKDLFYYFGTNFISQSQHNSILRLYNNDRRDVLWNLPKESKPDTFVISGGGIHGISVLGTIYCFRNVIPYVKYFFGTSSGSIISFFLALGLEIEEMYELLFQLDSTIKSTDDNLFASFVLVMSKFSLNNKNDKLDVFLQNVLLKKLGKKELTFRDLYKMTKKILVICGTCLNNGKAEYFSIITHPDMNIITAILISTCLPVIWSPLTFENKVYVDGGVIDNTPLFEAMKKCYVEINSLLEFNPDETRENMLQIYWKYEKISTMKIISTRNIICFDIRKDLSKLISTNEVMKSFPVYFSYILDSLASVSTITYIPDEFRKYIVPTYVPFDIGSRDLNIPNEKKEKLFICGIESAMSYIKTIQDLNS